MIFVKYPRKIYDFYHRQETIMNQGVELHVDVESLQKIDQKYGDWLIHPCIRHIPNGIGGHKWWMVVTPYPNFNCYYENPILYYGDGNSDVPPEYWVFVKIIQGPHRRGYNADCNLFYDGKKLWITWKEASTSNTNIIDGEKCIMGCAYNGQEFTNPIKICDNPDNTNMYVASQAFVRINNQIKMISVFTPNSYLDIPNKDKGPRHLSIFGNEGKEMGEGLFKYEGVRRQYYPTKFDFWHVDFFTYKEKKYCLVTPETANQVLLGESKDGEHYRFFKTPLLHANGKERTPYTYKVSGVIVGDMFYLFYPMRLNDKKVHVFVTNMNFDKLLKKILYYENWFIGRKS